MVLAGSKLQGLAYGESLHEIDYQTARQASPSLRFLAVTKGGNPKSAAPSSDLIAFVNFVVNELQQEPRDVPQDEGGDEVPVDHIPQAANAPVEAQVRVSQFGWSLGWGSAG